MRISLPARLGILLLVVILIFACNKKADFDSTALQRQRLLELTIPLQSGKYITYRLDSMIFTNFGRSTEIHSYLVKHVVDTSITDNLGRPSFRVFTFLSDTTGTQPWTPNGSYFITALDDRVEVIEDNLRVIKLHVPVEAGNSWKGNAYLPEDPYSEDYSFSNDDDMADWNFTFDGGMQPSLTMQDTTNSQTYTYTNTYAVAEDSEVDPSTDPSDYGSTTIAQEIYSKGIGLVYRELTMWEQQPNPSGNPPNVTYDPYKIGFGVKMWMVDHN